MNDLDQLSQDLARGFAVALGRDPDGDLGHIEPYVRDGRGILPATGASLLSWDANSIHSFVFDTTNATGIRGASDVLKRIDEQLVTGKALKLHRHQILYAGGGSGLAVVADEAVGSITERLHAFFARKTRLATCSVASAPLVSGDDGFRERVQAADRALARNRLLTGPDAEPMVPFFAERCEVCGRRAAADRPPRGVQQTPRFECDPCRHRIDMGKRNVRFQKEPTDYEAIADDVKGGFFAVLYFDGNGIGRTIQSLKSPLDYAAFSRAIAKVVRESFLDLATDYGLVEEGGGQGKARPKGTAYQLPICGGDDLVAILPGNVAVPFARDLLTVFEKASEEESSIFSRLGIKDLGASAGIAIGHGKFPIRHLLAESEELLKSAKRRVYHDKVRSALDFAVVTDGSPRTESVEPERWSAEPSDFIQSGRPYALTEFEPKTKDSASARASFTNRLRVVRGTERQVGRTQLFKLRAVAQSGQAQLRNHVLYQVGRRKEWRELIGGLAGKNGDEASSVVRDKERVIDQIAPEYGALRVFDLADMIDLYDHWREPIEELKESTQS